MMCVAGLPIAISGGLEGGIIEAQRAILEPSTPWRVVLQVRTVCACRRLKCVGICPVLTPQLQSFPQEATASGYPPEILLAPRSEEHTSELQSLMRISYAVFCLKKKTESPTRHSSIQHTTRD